MVRVGASVMVHGRVVVVGLAKLLRVKVRVRVSV